MCVCECECECECVGCVCVVLCCVALCGVGGGEGEGAGPDIYYWLNGRDGPPTRELFIETYSQVREAKQMFLSFTRPSAQSKMFEMSEDVSQA